jgi:nicotinamide mononucleotide (NMN) deamidase PncC
MLSEELISAAAEVAELISRLHLKLVLAESCTAGLVAAALGGVPGGSCWLCGSSVVYRTETKIAWLGVDPPHFKKPEPDSVGPQTSDALAKALLRTTPEADVAATISGHLGPEAPPDLDGRIFIRVLPTETIRAEFDDRELATSAKLQSKKTSSDLQLRRDRQDEAALLMLRQISAFLRQLAIYDDGTHRRRNPTP